VRKSRGLTFSERAFHVREGGGKKNLETSMAGGGARALINMRRGHGEWVMRVQQTGGAGGDQKGKLIGPAGGSSGDLGKARLLTKRAGKSAKKSSGAV